MSGLNENIDDFATGIYTVTRSTPGQRVNGRHVAAAPWIASHAYLAGDQVTNDSRTYQCSVPGTSAASGGPTTNTPSVDGAVHWTFLLLNTFTVVASVQPLSGKDLKDLKEGQRADEMRKMYVYTELLTRSDGTDPDTVVIDGHTYRVDTVEGPWTMDDETHWNVTVSKVSRP